CESPLGNPRQVNTIDAYDCLSDTWEEVAQIPTLRHHAGIVAHGSKIYIVGGFMKDSIFDKDVAPFVYCLLVGTFPFNSFLSGFISCVSSFVLGVCLRLQVNPENKNQFSGISPERGFADFIFAHIVLHLVVMNFIG
ncbi:hypothetical protein Trydic_g11302, partial [Trypoxylus dichotomus]